MSEDAKERRARLRCEWESRVIMAVSGPGASIKRAAEKLGCSTTAIYRCLGRLCEDWAEDEMVRKIGPRPTDRQDPRWNAWHRVWYRQLVKERKTFGLRTHGPWMLNGILNLGDHATATSGAEGSRSR